jgi:UDP-N-acetylglucosamine 2-epimerase (non-hydrolysing)
MKVMTFLGTRPEIIRLSRVIPLLDAVCDHLLVHTGQNYDERLSDLFFHELGIREPDIYMGVRGASFADQIGQILTGSERLLAEHRPDAVLVLGDTNSALSAFVAKRMGIRVYHMEAGNRCYDDRVPEEVNRRVIDHASDVLMPYTHRSAANLVEEGIDRRRIYVTGNPVKEVLDHYAPQIAATDPFSMFGVEPGRYFLVTAHRAETVDAPERLAALMTTLDTAVETYGIPALYAVHPRTADNMRACGIDAANVTFVPPMGLFDFVRLEQGAFCVLSDSGTVQEECCIFGVPTVTMRDVTERPETIECGSNILAGTGDRVLPAIGLAVRTTSTWMPPAEYLTPNVSDTVVRIMGGVA